MGSLIQGKNRPYQSTGGGGVAVHWEPVEWVKADHGQGSSIRGYDIHHERYLRGRQVFEAEGWDSCQRGVQIGADVKWKQCKRVSWVKWTPWEGEDWCSYGEDWDYM